MKGLVYASVGFVAGAVVGAIASRAYFMAEAEKEIAESRAYFDSMIDKFTNAEESVMEHDPETEEQKNEAKMTEHIREMEERIRKLNIKKANNIAKEQSYTSYFNESGSEEMDEEIEEGDGELGEYNNDKRELNERPPVIISEDEFSSDEKFDKQTMTLYEFDEVLVDEQDEVIDDIEMAIGRDNLKEFAADKDTFVVFVRNFRLDTDYEVSKIRASYKETHE